MEQSKWHVRIIVLTGFLLLCGLWLLVQHQISYERENELGKTAVATKNLAKAFEEHVRSIIANADGDMRTLQVAYEQRGASSPIVAAILEQIRKDPTKIQGGITNDKGIFVASSAPQAFLLNYADREWFLHLRENVTDQLYVGQTEASKMSGKSVIPLSRRLNRPDGSFAGVVHISLSLDYFDDVMKKMELGAGGVLSLHRMDGTNLVRKTPDSQSTGGDVRGGDVWKQAQVASQGVLVTPGALDGVERLFAYRVLQDYPLLIAVGSSTETLLAAFEQRKRNYLWGAAGVSIIIVGLCYLLIDRIRKQKAELLHLSRNMEIQTVLREIADAAVLSSSLNELYATVHRLIGWVLPAENFYVSLLDEETGRISRPYCRDETNSVPLERPPGKGLTEYFIRMGRAVHITPELFTRLSGSGELDLYLAPVFECVGAPLRDGQGKSFGVITVFVDDGFLHFQPEDVELLSIIAAQVSMAIERKQAEEALRTANENLERKVAERTQEIEAANEELLAQNEAITTMNEEIGSLNQNLKEMNDALELRVAERTTDLVNAHEALVEDEARYRAVLEQAPEAVILSDMDTGEILEANSRFVELTGYDLQQCDKLTLFELVVDTPQNISDAAAILKSTGKLPMQRRRMKHSRAGILDVERSATVVSYRGHQLSVMTIRDVSEELRRAQEDHFFALHDELTGLFNRRGFAGAVEISLAAEKNGALLLVDIDDFKIINDANGHAVGDQCLVALGRHLNEKFGAETVIARFVGGEFALFFAGAEGITKAIRAYNSMEVICLEISMGSFFIQLSGGISVVTKLETDLDLHIQRAYLAMHHAKENGKWCCKEYEPALQEQVGRRYAIKKALNNALANNEFHLVFQPIIDIRRHGQYVAGYEALLRWTSPLVGEVSPVEFIPVAEETNLILPIGAWVLREACMFSVRRHSRQGDVTNVAVNVSMRQLAMPSFVDMVKETLRETGLPAKNLNLEVTESILMTDAETRIGYLQELRDIGVSVSLDDFGTGYSSFTYLTQMPITTLKFDKSMVDGILEEGKNKKLLLESMLQMSALLGYEVVAEGVETEEQLEFLRKKGCDYCQGYLLGRPMPESAVIAMLSGNTVNE